VLQNLQQQQQQQPQQQQQQQPQQQQQQQVQQNQPQISQQNLLQAKMIKQTPYQIPISFNNVQQQAGQQTQRSMVNQSANPVAAMLSNIANNVQVCLYSILSNSNRLAVPGPKYYGVKILKKAMKVSVLSSKKMKMFIRYNFSFSTKFQSQF